MRARVTLSRVIRQYLDVPIPKVESPEDAKMVVEEILAHPDRRARLLAGEKWFGEDAVGEIEIVEVISVDT